MSIAWFELLHAGELLQSMFTSFLAILFPDELCCDFLVLILY